MATSFGPVRARSGAKQLADYLDSNRVETADRITRGYLVVLDVRRHIGDAPVEGVTEHKGLWYRDREVPYDPEYHRSRYDFEEPIRMFVEPKCQE